MATRQMPSPPAVDAPKFTARTGVSGDEEGSILSAAYKLGVLLDIRSTPKSECLPAHVLARPFHVIANWNPGLFDKDPPFIDMKFYPTEAAALPRVRGVISRAEKVSGLSLAEMVARAEERGDVRAAAMPEPLSVEAAPAVAEPPNPFVGEKVPQGPAEAGDMSYVMSIPFCDHGHSMNGHMNVSRYRHADGRSAREDIVVDIARDSRLRKAVSDVVSRAEGRDESSFTTGEQHGMLMADTFNVIREGIRSNEKAFEGLDRILLGDAFEEGGACRHKGLAAAVILEQMILSEKLGGRVYYVRGPAHGWAVYRTRAGEFFVFDPAQQEGPINIKREDAYYTNKGQRVRYDSVEEWRGILDYDRELSSQLDRSADTVSAYELTVDPSKIAGSMGEASLWRRIAGYFR